MISTYCGKCIFAEYNELDKRKQEGCLVGRLQKFKDKGLEIFYDDNNVATIPDMCNTFRQKEWGDFIKKNKKDPLVEIFKEVETRVHFIIVIDENYTEKDFHNSFRTPCKQILNPYHISVIVRNEEAKKHIGEIIRYAGMMSNGLKHTVTKITDDIPTDFFINNIVKDSKAQYYVKLNCGETVEENLTKLINDYINVRLEKFSMIRASNKPAVIQVGVHKMLLHSIETGFELAIEQLAKEQGVEHMIKNWEELE